MRIIEADLKSKALPQLDLQDLFEQTVYITRLYITRGIKLTPKDPDGLADPFLVVKNGRHRQVRDLLRSPALPMASLS